MEFDLGKGEDAGVQVHGLRLFAVVVLKHTSKLPNMAYPGSRTLQEVHRILW